LPCFVFFIDRRAAVQLHGFPRHWRTGVFKRRFPTRERNKVFFFPNESHTPLEEMFKIFHDVLSFSKCRSQPLPVSCICKIIHCAWVEVWSLHRYCAWYFWDHNDVRRVNNVSYRQQANVQCGTITKYSRTLNKRQSWRISRRQRAEGEEGREEKMNTES
jgi:hypothetical protein